MRTIPAGHRAEHRLRVEPRMTVDFEQPDPLLGRLHPVYATYWLTKHLELVSRKIILPFLEAPEEGVGFEVRVRHLAPALPGMELHLEARLERLDARPESGRTWVHASCRAVSELGDLVGEGATTQLVLPRRELDASFAELRARLQRARERTPP